VDVHEEREYSGIFAAVDPDGMLAIDVDFEYIKSRVRLDWKSVSRHAVYAGIGRKVVREL
jgi:hypothetical protein